MTAREIAEQALPGLVWREDYKDARTTFLGTKLFVGYSESTEDWFAHHKFPGFGPFEGADICRSQDPMIVSKELRKYVMRLRLAMTKALKKV